MKVMRSQIVQAFGQAPIGPWRFLRFAQGGGVEVFGFAVAAFAIEPIRFEHAGLPIGLTRVHKSGVTKHQQRRTSKVLHRPSLIDEEELEKVGAGYLTVRS